MKFFKNLEVAKLLSDMAVLFLKALQEAGVRPKSRPTRPLQLVENTAASCI